MGYINLTQQLPIPYSYEPQNLATIVPANTKLPANTALGFFGFYLFELWLCWLDIV